MKNTALIFTLLCAGCSATGSWVHQDSGALSSSAAFSADKAECRAIAMRSIEIPEVQSTQPTTYRTSGTIVDASGRSATYSETTRVDDGAYDPVAAGVEEANQRHARSAALRARHDLEEACLVRRGWVKE